MHGSIWNAADPARSLAIGESTVRRYLDLFTSLLVVRRLQPWHENLSKRQVKAAKAYVRDSGSLHSLPGLRTETHLPSHPKSGASWGGFAIERVLTWLQPDEAYFWATHQGAELDLLCFKHGKRWGFEFKRADAPTMTPSMRVAFADLRLDRRIVVYPGQPTYQLTTHATAMPPTALAALSTRTLRPIS